MPDSDTRCGYVAIIGAPNAGKSTLLNQVVGSKIAIVTPKVQTTRNRILGMVASGETQIIFVDTPGIFAAGKMFEKAMVESAWSGATDADMVLLLVDATKGINSQTLEIIEKLKELPTKKAVAINKIDLVKKHELLALAQELGDMGEFAQIFMLSARTGDGIEDLQHWLAGELPQGAWLFPEDQMSDVPLRLLAAEITREKLFMKLQQELPYSVIVETEEWDERKNGSLSLRQVIFVERESQKKIILGHKGSMIKSIGQDARKELEQMWECKVNLFLFVKVSPKWKEQQEMYNYLGLEYKK